MDAWRAIKRRWRMARARAEVEARLREPPMARPHGLPHPLVVSLTSYPARFPTLHLTLSALLLQTVRADATVLWLAEGDEAALPSEVLSLRARGLEVRLTRDLRSFKKVVPALAAFPEAAIVTADDDLYFPATWLADLVAAAADPLAVPCHRAHRIGLGPTGDPLPYESWAKNVPRPERGPLVFPTGGTGTLFLPGSLHEDAGRAELFMELCPTSDDLWLWWMHRLAGRVAAKIGGPVRILEWPGSQGGNLRSVNLGDDAGNDRAVAALVGRYGLPLD